MDRQAGSVTNCRKLAEGVEFFDFRAKMPLTAMREVGRFAATHERGEDPMSTSAYTRIPVIILAALALAACPWKKDKKHDETPAVYYVSASAGSDTNPGTQNSQFKRLTHA